MCTVGLRMSASTSSTRVRGPANESARLTFVVLLPSPGAHEVHASVRKDSPPSRAKRRLSRTER